MTSAERRDSASIFPADDTPAPQPCALWLYDGKDSPVKGNNPDADTVARKRIDANTIETVSKKGGKVTTTQTSTVSADGKTRTVRTTGVNASGQKANNVAVYERQ